MEAIIASSAFYLFIVHTFTACEPFVSPTLFRDRNFTAGVIFILVVGLTYYASLALQPPYLQNLMDYPIVSAGFVLGPRGISTMGAMMIVGKLIGRVDTRLLLAIGLGLTAVPLVNLKDRKHRTEGFRVPLVERAIEISGRPITAHGFRAAFRTWAEEVATVPHAVIEQAMGHQVGTQVERAYRRTDVLDKRRTLMEAWVQWCEPNAVRRD
jgi:hypothetical protein